MSEQTTIVGKLCGAGAVRDAIHFAVAPIMASRVGDELKPGTHVGLTSSGEATPWQRHIGIVDPFLRDAVQPGQTFWLFMYPNTITGLRHHWDHPSFPNTSGDKAASEAWLRAYANGLRPYDRGQPGEVDSYELMMANILGDQTVFAWGTDLHTFGDLPQGEEFLRHLSVVLGRSVAPDDLQYSCSC